MDLMSSAHPNLASSNLAQFDNEPQGLVHRPLIAKGLMDVRIQKNEIRTRMKPLGVLAAHGSFQ